MTPRARLSLSLVLEPLLQCSLLLSQEGLSFLWLGGESPEVPRGQWDNGEAVTDETLRLSQSSLHPTLTSWLASGTQSWPVDLLGLGSWSDTPPPALSVQRSEHQSP